MGLPVLLCSVLCVCAVHQTTAQNEEPIFNNSFNDDLGIWNSSTAVISTLDSDPGNNWLALQKTGSSQPSITSQPIYLKDFCSVSLSFDFVAENTNATEDIFVQVSSDGGNTFQILRDDMERSSLHSKNTFLNGSRQHFHFPIRGFLSDSLILRISTNNLNDNGAIFLDNLRLEATPDEDYLLAYWEMGSQASSDKEQKLEGESARGNCGGITAEPVGLPASADHLSVEGYTYDVISDSSDTSLLPSDGGLCVSYQNTTTFEPLTFSILLAPEDRGRISGFEFLELAPIDLDGRVNNYPTKFDIKIFKDEDLVFSQSNISTSRFWSDRVFRLEHINELIIAEQARFTFQLTPTEVVGNRGGMSVWIIDEVKVFGGCCDEQCDQISLTIDEKETTEGTMLTPLVDDKPSCSEPCSGSITNEKGEAVSLLTNQAIGWSFYNNATTVLNSKVDMDLPRNFRERSFRIEEIPSQQAQYIESDLINLCPGEKYSVCFDHLSTSAADDDVGVYLTVNNKRIFVATQQFAEQTCMSFVASQSNEPLRLEAAASGNIETSYYLDNIFVENIKTVEEQEVSVIWNGDQSTNPVDPQIRLSEPSTFQITSEADTTATFKNKNLYSLSFSTLSKANTAEVDVVKVVIDGLIEKEFPHDLSADKLYMRFLTNERNHEVAYELLDKDGAIINDEKLILVDLAVNVDSINVDHLERIAGLEWILPDGTTQPATEILADQQGEYNLQFSNCFGCIKTESILPDFDAEVCPPHVVSISCDTSLDPEVNEELELNEPDSPYAIGESMYFDIPTTSAVLRFWTVERTYRATVLDTVSCLQTIRFYDELSPVFPEFTETSLTCIADLPVPGELNIEDNCAEEIFLSSSDSESLGDGCPNSPIIITRNWVAVDEEGNQSTAEEIFSIVHEAPVVTCPAAKTVECEAELLPEELDVSWPCMERALSYDTVLTLTEGNQGCNGAIYEMSYTITDDCGRISHCYQALTLSGQDLEITCPDAEVVDCIEDFTHGVPDYFSDCNHMVQLTMEAPVLASGGMQCSGSIYEVVYSVTDACDQEANCIQEVEIQNSGLSLTCPSNQVVDCSADISPSVPTILAACNVSTSYSSGSPHLSMGIADCDGSIYQLTYTATDFCGNVLNCIQEFTISKPGLSITCPANYTVSCYNDIANSAPVISSYCNTGPFYVVSLPVALSTSFSCDGEVYQVQYTALNQCGESSSCLQQVTLSNTGPSLTCPQARVVSCVEDIISESPAMSNTCNVSTTLDVTAPILMTGQNNCNAASYILTYTLSDDCGNQLNCNQSFTLSNNSISMSCPANISVLEFDEIVASDPVVETSCNLGLTVISSSPSLENITCDLATYKIFYTVTGECGDQASCEQTITLLDDNNAIDANFICANPDLFIGLDCDMGGIEDVVECLNGLDPEEPCDDVSFVVDIQDALCFGEHSGIVSITTHNGNPPYEFSMDNTNWTSVSQFDNLAAGNYVVYIQNTYGPDCSYEYDFTISEPALSPADAGADTEICIGYPAILTASGGAAYLWSTEESTASITVSPASTTNYTVTVTQADGCYNTDEVLVTVHENNAADAGQDQEICIDYSAVLQATGGSSYLWSTGQTNPVINVTPLQTSNYFVTVTDINGCTDVDEVRVIVNSNNSAYAGTDQTICLNEEAQLTATGGATYLWSTGASTANILVSPGTTSTYLVTVSDINGCTDVDEVIVNVNDLPTADAGADQDICLNGAVTLSASGGVSYEWSNGMTGNVISVSPTANSSYTVTVTDANGCTDTDLVEVTVLDLPTALVSTKPERIS